MEEQPHSQGRMLSIVVPTLNERDNVRALVARLDAALSDLDWEIIFVDDDSTDGTPDVIRELSASDTRVRLLQRIGRKGLSSAAIEGLLSASAPLLAVMDGDLQHDEKILPEMCGKILDGSSELVVASRYVTGGGFGNWSKNRRFISQVATTIAGKVFGAQITDPMSGFFVMRREVFQSTMRKLSGIGFKLLLDILLSMPRKFRVSEVPLNFNARESGQSKMSFSAAWDLAFMLLEKSLANLFPARFLMFCAIGTLGLIIHLSFLRILHGSAQLDFAAAQLGATVFAMTSNYFLNNHLTFRPNQRRGVRALSGLASFYLVCSVGLIANVGVAQTVFDQQGTWWVSGIAGALVGAIWNYAVSSNVTWRS